MIRRAYDEPIPFIPVVDKTNVQKPRDIKIPLRQNPAVANSNKVEKTFQEFVENSPERVLSLALRHGGIHQGRRHHNASC